MKVSKRRLINLALWTNLHQKLLFRIYGWFSFFVICTTFFGHLKYVHSWEFETSVSFVVSGVFTLHTILILDRVRNVCITRYTHPGPRSKSLHYTLYSSWTAFGKFTLHVILILDHVRKVYITRYTHPRPRSESLHYTLYSSSTAFAKIILLNSLLQHFRISFHILLSSAFYYYYYYYYYHCSYYYHYHYYYSFCTFAPVQKCIHISTNTYKHTSCTQILCACQCEREFRERELVTQAFITQGLRFYAFAYSHNLALPICLPIHTRQQ